MGKALYFTIYNYEIPEYWREVSEDRPREWIKEDGRRRFRAALLVWLFSLPPSGFPTRLWSKGWEQAAGGVAMSMLSLIAHFRLLEKESQYSGTIGRKISLQESRSRNSLLYNMGIIANNYTFNSKAPAPGKPRTSNGIPTSVPIYHVISYHLVQATATFLL